MTPRLKISNSVISRLGTVKKASTGCLFGLMYDNTLLVVGFNIEPSFENISTHDQLENTRKNYKSRMHNFPTEVDLCGLITFAEDIDKAENHSGVIKILEEVDITDNPLLMVCTLGSVKDYGLQTNFYVHDKLVKVVHEVVDETTLWKEFVHVRVQSRLPLVCELESHDLRDALQSLHKKVATGTLAFCFANNIYLTGGDSEGLSGVDGLSGDSTIGHLYKLQVERTNDFVPILQNRRRSGNTFKDIDVLNASLLMKPTRELRSESQLSSAPIIQHIKKSYECLQAWLHVDALSMVARSAPLSDLYAVLVESVCRNLKLTEHCLLQQLAAGVGKPDAPPTVSLPQPTHFLPPGFSHFVTLALPESRSDEQLAEYRRALHQDFALPMDRPLFRKGNAYHFRNEQPGAGLLINPHECLAPSGVKGGRVSLVQGLYSYHHYMQDRMDDDGWGCAYRSLQTIVSWYRWQGYTARAPPTHREIQECLVQLGDKPSSFIGSRQWIGSTEVSFCLEAMLGVTSRILSVSSGEELGSHGGELTLHFQTHGTPIMIGGGVLAHTILGVDYNRSSGELKFLILDPHYTGGEDLGVVLAKGWCGWKGLNFWAKNAFYNLCLPQRPRCV